LLCIWGWKNAYQVSPHIPHFNIIALIKGKTTFRNLATTATWTAIINKKPENTAEGKNSTESTRNSAKRTLNHRCQHSSHWSRRRRRKLRKNWITWRDIRRRSTATTSIWMAHAVLVTNANSCMNKLRWLTKRIHSSLLTTPDMSFLKGFRKKEINFRIISHMNPSWRTLRKHLITHKEA